MDVQQRPARLRPAGPARQANPAWNVPELVSPARVVLRWVCGALPDAVAAVSPDADSFYSSALDEIGTALDRWSRPYLCASAQKHVDIANRLMPKGDDALNDGMARLKSLR